MDRKPAKHTPGPWHTHKIKNGALEDWTVYADREQAFDLATVYDDGRPSAKANARLIAAAPDLLAVCRAVVENDEHAAYCATLVRPADRRLKWTPGPCNCFMAAAIAAIAKAEGDGNA